MQSILALALMIIIALFSMMEFRRNSITNDDYSQYRADRIVGNIKAYNDLIYQYAIANYDSQPLHSMNGTVANQVTLITPIDYIANDIATYSQESLDLFLNYQSVTFNYVSFMTESIVIPTLYLATTWNNFNPNMKTFNNISLIEVMGLLNQLFTKDIYQGNSTYWTVPLLLVQDKCNVIEMYSQIPNAAAGNSQLNDAKTFFKQLCTQIEANSSFRFLQYVYLEPVFKIGSQK